MANDMTTTSTKILVLGAGFGGLTFCQTFRHANASVTVVDAQNHHLFQPLLYQVAAAGLSAPEIAEPARSILSRRKDVTVLMDRATGFDLAAQRVHCESHTLDYDYLVVALPSIGPARPIWRACAMPSARRCVMATRITSSGSW
jgi:NADH:ubiquinone reductase (H+-translocating)